MEKSNRIAFIDYVRALCVIWIVGFYHMSEYCFYNLKTAWSDNMTMGVLGGFVFISGFLLGNMRIATKRDVILFYRKRLLRVYPLFLISCLSLYGLHLVNEKIGYISSFRQLILTLFGLSCFVTPAPLTVWFMSILIFLYFITPFINAIRSEGKKACVLLCFSVVLIIIRLLGAEFDDRLLYLIPLYCVGLCLSNKNVFNYKIKCYFIPAVTGMMGYLFFTFTKASEMHYFIKNILVSAFFTMFILCFMRIIEASILKIVWLDKILAAISYSSFCMYLFHRQIFRTLAFIIRPFPVLAAYLIILPGIIIFSYYVQKVYDNCMGIRSEQKGTL